MTLHPKQLRAALAVLQLSHARLGELAGVHGQTIWRLQNPETNSSVKTSTVAKVRSALEAQNVELLATNGKVGILVPED